MHEEILAERVWRRKVAFAAAHFGDFLDEVDQGIVTRKHEGVDHDSRPLALVHFFQGLADDEGVEPECILVDATVFQRESGRLSIRNHNNLPHVFFLAEQNALSHAQPVAQELWYSHW